MRRPITCASLILYGSLILLAANGSAADTAPTLKSNNTALFMRLRSEHGLRDEQLSTLQAIFERSGYIGQGNPALSKHPVSSEQCQAQAAELDNYENPLFERICGGRHMAPLYDPASEPVTDARVCIDQFEFPNLPCAYPVVWVRAREAADICQAAGKRLCDAHEWEGACAGSLQPPDYRFDLARNLAPAAAIKRMATAHNAARTRTWAYGPDYRKGICAAGSHKSAGCEGGGWKLCGSNTYPAGTSPACVSPLGVHDLHGNAAEHMNLPLDETQMASRGSRELGHTEMKGSWFIFDSYYAHQDDCRWRAPYWHGSKVMDPASHQNYHLGFRCCKTLIPAAPAGGPLPQSGG